MTPFVTPKAVHYTLSRAFILIALGLAMTGCGSSATGSGASLPQVDPFGAFASSGCFLNKLATQGVGQDIYSRATLTLRADGTGRTEFDLYTDAGCGVAAQSGQAEITYTVLRALNTAAGPGVLLQVDQQNDPGNPSDTIRYWLPALVDSQGYLIDIDYRDGQSGPYVTEPTDAEMSEFLADPSGEGMRFNRL